MTFNVSRFLIRWNFISRLRLFQQSSNFSVVIPTAFDKTTFRLNSNHFPGLSSGNCLQLTSCISGTSRQRANDHPSDSHLPNSSLLYHLYRTQKKKLFHEDSLKKHALCPFPFTKKHSLITWNCIARYNGSILRRNVLNVFKEKPLSQACRTLTTRGSDMETKGRPVVRTRTKQPATKAPKEKMLVCIAYTTAEEYDLEGLEIDIRRLDIFRVMKMPQDAFDVIHVRHDPEPRSDGAQVDRQSTQGDIFFFRDGMVVFWNVEDQTMRDVRQMLEQYERNPYNIALVEWENEQMNYSYTENSTLLSNGDIQLSSSAAEMDMILEKYTFSNAMGLSVKLAIWEAWLDDYVDSIMYIPELLREGKRLKMSRPKVMQKIGELFALKYRINLGSDLLITPDFYWDREHLEGLYLKTCRFLNIPGRTTVVNEKLRHCQELAELMRTHLSERHSLRLEWMIIALIAIEVLFEVVRIFSRTFTEPESVKEQK
ncbi:required for meiotic nuclear division protein 1 homolog [Branchiostoma lanceolatum]|uniref:required for meiotic nuclear division protein 1 homolog n=1 Tax=Branchiostoma lanceolatum TaxID=7740 RepID=UPI0034519E2C